MDGVTTSFLCGHRDHSRSSKCQDHPGLHSGSISLPQSHGKYYARTTYDDWMYAALVSITKLVHIQTDLIFKLKNEPLFLYVESKSSLYLIFYFWDLSIKFLLIKNLSSWVHIQDISSIFLIILFYQSLIIIWSTTYQFYEIAFMYQAYILMIIISNIKSNQTTMINCHSYDNTTHTLQMSSGLSCCSRE